MYLRIKYRVITMGCVVTRYFVGITVLSADKLHSPMTLHLLIIMVTYAPVNTLSTSYLNEILYAIVFLINVQSYAKLE